MERDDPEAAVNEESSQWCELTGTERTMISSDTLGALILEVEDDCSTQFCHELHDGLSQLLMALQAHLQVHDLAGRAGKPEKAAEELAKSRECLNQAVRECRRLVSSQAGEDRDLAASLQGMLQEAGARWNWASADFHDLRSGEQQTADGQTERLLALVTRRLISAFRRKHGARACLELRSGVGPPPVLCVELTVSGNDLLLPSPSMGHSSTEETLKRTRGLTEALGGILKIETHSPEELRVAIVLPASEPRPGTS
jgi:signal transduction histidine kinase